MARLQGALLTLFAAAVVTAPAAAQVAGRPWELSGQGGWIQYDTRSHLKAAPGFGGTLGWRAQSYLTLEGQALFGPTK